MLPWNVEGRVYHHIRKNGNMVIIIFDKNRVMIADPDHRSFKLEGEWLEEDINFYRKFEGWTLEEIKGGYYA